MPVAGEPVRLVRARHEACGGATRVRLPRAVPAQVVRRVVCDRCHEPFECEAVQDGGVEARARGWLAAGRRWLSDPDSHAWRYLSIPVAAAAVIGALTLIQGTGSSTNDTTAPSSPAAGSGNAKSHGARVVKGSNYTLALPPGWRRTEPKNGATFAADASDGGADATLWIRRDPSLSFPKFEVRSLAQLRSLAGSSHVVDRTTGPTPESTVITLAADSPPGQPTYQVTLRVSGPYRYYLATTVDANASRQAADGADLIHHSFIPSGGKRG